MSEKETKKAEYEGKAKRIITTEKPDVVIQSFKDDATAFNGVKKESFRDKGKLNNAFSCYFFELLRSHGIETHFIGRLNDTDMLVKRLKIIPVEVVARNAVSGSLQKRTGLEEGVDLRIPIVETYYKSDELGDPLLADMHIELLQLAKKEELAKIKAKALEINAILVKAYAEKGLRLVDIKMEFGYDSEGTLLLGDEISPDVSRIWDAETGRKFDKDVFRKDLGDLVESYRVVAERLGVEVDCKL